MTMGKDKLLESLGETLEHYHSDSIIPEKPSTKVINAVVMSTPYHTTPYVVSTIIGLTGRSVQMEHGEFWPTKNDCLSFLNWLTNGQKSPWVVDSEKLKSLTRAQALELTLWLKTQCAGYASIDMGDAAQIMAAVFGNTELFKVGKKELQKYVYSVSVQFELPIFGILWGLSQHSKTFGAINTRLKIEAYLSLYPKAGDELKQLTLL